MPWKSFLNEESAHYSIKADVIFGQTLSDKVYRKKSHNYALLIF